MKKAIDTKAKTDKQFLSLIRKNNLCYSQKYQKVQSDVFKDQKNNKTKKISNNTNNNNNNNSDQLLDELSRAKLILG